MTVSLILTSAYINKLWLPKYIWYKIFMIAENTQDIVYIACKYNIFAIISDENICKYKKIAVASAQNNLQYLKYLLQKHMSRRSIKIAYENIGGSLKCFKYLYSLKYKSNIGFYTAVKKGYGKIIDYYISHEKNIDWSTASEMILSSPYSSLNLVRYVENKYKSDTIDYIIYRCRANNFDEFELLSECEHPEYIIKDLSKNGNLNLLMEMRIYLNYDYKYLLASGTLNVVKYALEYDNDIQIIFKYNKNIDVLLYALTLEQPEKFEYIFCFNKTMIKLFENKCKENIDYYFNYMFSNFLRLHQSCIIALIELGAYVEERHMIFIKKYELKKVYDYIKKNNSTRYKYIIRHSF